MAAGLVPGWARADAAEVAARREELAAIWAQAERSGHEAASMTTSALLAVQDAVLGHLTALEAVTVERGSVAARLLDAASRHPGMPQTQLAELTATAPETVSREGARLEDRGLVVRRRIGRQRLWELTPRGRAAVERLAGPTLVPTPTEHERGSGDQGVTPPHLQALISEERMADAEMREVPESLHDRSTAAMFAGVA